MDEQAPLALPPPAGTAHWNENVLFGPRLMESLAGINAQFLGLVVDLHGARPGMPVLGLPAHLLALLGRCAERAAALPLPYGLYDLRFRDERFWRQAVGTAIAVRDAQPPPGIESRVVRFARDAVTFAWHLAQSEPRVAGLALGAGRPTLELLAEVPVGALEALARRTAPALAARFCTRERFWQQACALLRFGPDEAAAARLKLLGLQLQGAEAARAQQIHRRVRRSAQA